MYFIKQGCCDVKRSLSSPRNAIQQVMTLATVVCTALVLWKFLMLCTGTEAPVVVVLSGSMEPGFHRGDILMLRHFEEMSSGDIVVFKLDEREIPIVHRAMNVYIDNKGKHTFLTKGDNNSVDDRGLYTRNQLWLNRSHVMGTVIGLIPMAGMMTIYLNDYAW